MSIYSISDVIGDSSYIITLYNTLKRDFDGDFGELNPFKKAKSPQSGSILEASS